jgi:hypothetical protein
MAERTHQKKFVPWKLGDKVWLSAAHLITRLPSRKLAPKRYGPFTIAEVLSPITYKLHLPKTWRVHPTFHASELSSYHETEIHGPNYPEPPPDVVNGEEEYEVDAILAHRGQKGKRSFLVSWKGYPNSENSWLPEKELRNAPQLLKTYKERLHLARILS